MELQELEKPESVLEVPDAHIHPFPRSILDAPIISMGHPSGIILTTTNPTTQVPDADIVAPRWISPEQQAQLDKLAEEEAAREAAKKDSPFERALMEMMGGTPSPPQPPYLLSWMPLSYLRGIQVESITPN